jgi:hypothetical protein
MVQTDKNLEIDERVWQAWIQKNAAQDKVRFARRVKIIGIASVFLALTALLWEAYAG